MGVGEGQGSRARRGVRDGLAPIPGDVSARLPCGDTRGEKDVRTLRRKKVFRKIKAATVAICRREEDMLIPFGSGINVDRKGFIITAKHAIEATLPGPIISPSEGGPTTGTILQQRLFAVFCIEQGEELLVWALPPYVTGGLHSHDLAFIRPRLDGNAPIDALPCVVMGDSDKVYEGEQVLTCGFPLGKVLQPALPTGSLFQEGIVSSIRPHALATSRSEFFLDMTINPGNSGGPLCRRGSAKLIGVVNARIERPDVVPTGISCAVPLNVVKPLVEKLIAMSADELRTYLEEKMGEGHSGDLF